MPAITFWSAWDGEALAGFVELKELNSTGTAAAFDPANRLYQAAGFVAGPAFGGYPASPHNRFMKMVREEE